MKNIKVKTYAKINLTLDITGEKDGFHLLDSFVSTIELFDTLVVKKRKDKLTSVIMHGMNSENIPPSENNIIKAGEMFSNEFRVSGVDVEVRKNIPIGAGLGGSSADMAGLLNAMAKLYDVEDEKRIEDLAMRLGSDVKFMLKGGYCRMQGRGEKLYPLKHKKTLWMLLICPESSVSAGKCYKEYDNLNLLGKTERNTDKVIDNFLKNDINEMGKFLSNDLYLAAKNLNLEVGKAYEEAESFSPLGVTMTGSGSCIVALFENREMCDWARSRYRGKFKTYVVRTFNPESKTKDLRFPFALTKEEHDSFLE